jgi:hypothetical protein
VTNHVHSVVVPEGADSLAILFRRVHGRYSQYLNARRRRSGQERGSNPRAAWKAAFRMPDLWQNGCFSCAVERGRTPGRSRGGDSRALAGLEPLSVNCSGSE